MTAAPAERPQTLSAPASNVLSAVGAQYAAISNLSCTVRREASDGKGGTVEAMSRIAWARGDRLHVEGLKGGGRRVVIDGKSVYVKHPGEAAPAKYKVEDQLPTQLANLRSVPASPEEMLAPLASLAATESEPPAPYARAVAFSEEAGKMSATVLFDTLGRVARIDFLTATGEGKPPAASSATFKAPFEALPGVWLFRRVETEATVEGVAVSAVTRFDRIEVNGELPDAVFDPNNLF